MIGSNECDCKFTGWEHDAEEEGDTGITWITKDVGTWINVVPDIISALQVEGECNLWVADGNDGADQWDYFYAEGVYSVIDEDVVYPEGILPLETGNDNINSVMLECANYCDRR